MSESKTRSYKQLNIKVENELFDLVTAYAEKERRSVNSTVLYIIQKFFSGQ